MLRKVYDAIICVIYSMLYRVAMALTKIVVLK